MAVIPYIDDPDARIRATDELPQSGEGKMIMTVEPKFVPNQAARIFVEENLGVNIPITSFTYVFKYIDCLHILPPSYTSIYENNCYLEHM